MLRRFRMDLHIHTCLSPCADSEMVPTKIVKKAKSKGLDVIGICDHNSAENVMAVKRAGEREKLGVIGGIEITSREEVHILAFFDKENNLFELQKIIYDNLSGINDEKIFGEQIIVDEKGKALGFNKRLLIGATELSIEKVVDTIHSLDGLAIASHIDRERFGIIGQLGFIPDDLNLDGLEVSPKVSLENRRLKFSQASDSPLVTFSDAHTIQDIGKSATSFLINEARVSEIKKGLLNQDGRSILTHLRYSGKLN